MTEEEVLEFLKALGKDDWEVAEFPPGSGMYVSVMSLAQDNKIK